MFWHDTSAAGRVADLLATIKHPRDPAYSIVGLVLCDVVVDYLQALLGARPSFIQAKVLAHPRSVHAEVGVALGQTRLNVLNHRQRLRHVVPGCVVGQLIDQVIEWQSRPLDAVYPIVYLDCIVLKIRQNKRIINKSMYLALGINMDGHKELLGLWLAETEGAKFWLGVMSELKTRGLKDILIACVDGLKGFPDAIRAEYPDTRVQLCIVHRVRHSLKYVTWKDYKAVTAGLKQIYQSATEEQALQALDQFAGAWDGQYLQIAKSWRNNWDNLVTIYDYPPEIRRVIYTTNAIESLNSVIRKATRQRKLFPSDDSAMKVVHLAMQAASKKWTMPIHNWKPALNRFMIVFGDRLGEH